MKKTTKKIFSELALSCFVLCLLLISQSSLAYSNANPVTPKFVDGSILFDFKTSYFKSTENFDSGGSKISLTSGNYFQIIDAKSTLRWGFSENMGLFTGFSIGSSESNNSIATRKNSTLNQILLGADWRPLSFQAFDMFTRLTYIHAPEKIASDTDSVMNSSGSAQVIPEIGILMPLGTFNLYGTTGYNYRTEGLSGLIPYRIGVELALSSFSVFGGIEGSATVTDDKETANSVNRDIINNRVNAGSKKFYSVNPNETNIDVGMNFQVNPSWGINAFAKYGVVGSNSAAGYEFGFGFSWELAQVLSATKEKMFRPKKESQLSRDTVPADFTEDTNDGVNQDYFKQVPSPTQSPKKMTPPGKQMQIDSSVDDTDADKDVEITTKRKKQEELKIKLKRKKK
jgi:hypothetical protein